MQTLQPRARGEHVVNAIGAPAVIASAPHARGTPQIAGRERMHHRFSPARAGNTSSKPPGA